MGVGKVGGGGRGGRAGGAKGAGGPSGPAKTSGAKGFSTVDRAEGLVGPSGLAGSGNVGAAAPADPLSATALQIAAQVKSGELTKEEGKKRFIAEVLEEKLRLKSESLTKKIVEQLADDPRLNQTLDRIVSKG